MQNSIEQYYFIEHTDLFQGEANYCWVKRYKVLAKDSRQAMRRLCKYLGTGYKGQKYEDEIFYDCYSYTIYFVYWYEEAIHEHYNLITIN